MLTKVFGAAVHGIDAIVVTIEVSVDTGIGYTIVGLPDAAVKESNERIRTAMKQCGQSFPHRQVVVNMSPADVRKEGAAYDLPLATGILAADGKINADRLARFMIMGELSLDGSVLPIKGALPMAIKARELGYEGFIVPKANVKEAAVVNNLDVYGVENMKEVIGFFNGEYRLKPTVINTREEFFSTVNNYDFDFSEVRGQENVKRAFEVACAGGHNIILVGDIAAVKPARSIGNNQNTLCCR